MSAHSTAKWLFAWSIVFVISLPTLTIAAEPGVVKASHEVKAQEPPRDSKEPQETTLTYSLDLPEPPNTGAMLTRFFVGSGVVLVLCVAMMWFGKPWLQKLQVTGMGNPSFQVEGSLAVGNRAMLFLVRVGETQLIAGTDGTGLKSLIALPPTFKEVLDTQITEAETETPAAPRPFEVRAASAPARRSER